MFAVIKEGEGARLEAHALALLRSLHTAGGQETELYRVWDVATSDYHSVQTKGRRAGSLVLVRQGKHGAISIMYVGGRCEERGDDADEFTVLMRHF